MTRKILTAEIPLWLAIAAMVVVGTVGAALFVYFREVVYNYNLFLPQGERASSVAFKYGAQPALANAEFFKKVRDAFIAQKSNFIEADLSRMSLKMYEDGVVVKEVPILTKGREGSWWETPAGLYKIESKEKNHFSSFGKVYQPWSLAFQGNFFIHGWPYYPDGTPVASDFSGGCIRLKSEDAEAVFAMAKVGMPVLVFEKDFEADAFRYEFRAPDISAPVYLAADLKNNFVFLEKGAGTVVPIASLSKLVTALVATEYINLEKIITVPAQAIVKTSKARLVAGEKVSAYDLLFPLLLESSNEAAAAFASVLGRVRFVELMNDKAKALGMTSSHFVDAAGSGEGNVSTVEDLFQLAKYIYNNRSFILKISAGKLKDSIYGEPRFKDLSNFNIFADDPDFVGGKVGKTEAAGETILSVFEREVKGEKRAIAIIVLGSMNNEKDARAILDYFKANY